MKFITRKENADIEDKLRYGKTGRMRENKRERKRNKHKE